MRLSWNFIVYKVPWYYCLWLTVYFNYYWVQMCYRTVSNWMLLEEFKNRFTGRVRLLQSLRKTTTNDSIKFNYLMFCIKYFRKASRYGAVLLRMVCSFTNISLYLWQFTLFWTFELIFCPQTLITDTIKSVYIQTKEILLFINMKTKCPKSIFSMIHIINN